LIINQFLNYIHGGIKLKIAITTEGIDLNSNISPVFGRSPYIIMVNLDDSNIISWTVIENPARFEKGAGNMTSHFLVNQGIDILISGEMGPIAFYLLRNAEIKVYKAASVSAEKNLKRFIDNKLKEITTISSGYPK